MSVRNLAAVTAAAALAVVPAAVQAAPNSRTSAPAGEANELGASPLLIAAAIVAIIVGIILLTDDDDSLSA
jgi:hypothetical protein